MIEVKSLCKRFGNNMAVNGISFSIKEGEVVGLLGPNGAGKSTTMNIVTGYLSASSGSVSIGGYDILENPIEAKRLIGYLPEQAPLYQDMTVKEYLEFIFDLKKCKFNKKEHLKEIADIVKINDVYNRLISNLSKGYKQRVGLAYVLIGAPPVLILDEPTVGLDPKEIVEIRNLITKLGKSRTVIVSSHILSEIQAVCERVIVINKGKLVADGTPEDLANASAESNIMRMEARISGKQSDVKSIVKSISGVKKVTVLPTVEEGTTELIIEGDKNSDFRKALFNTLADNNMNILMLKAANDSLEELFMTIIDQNKEIITTKNESESEPDTVPESETDENVFTDADFEDKKEEENE